MRRRNDLHANIIKSHKIGQRTKILTKLVMNLTRYLEEEKEVESSD